MSASAQVTIGGSGGMMSTARLEFALTTDFPGQVSGRNFSEGKVM